MASARQMIDPYVWREPLSKRVSIAVGVGAQGTAVQIHGRIFWEDEADRIIEVLKVLRRLMETQP